MADQERIKTRLNNIRSVEPILGAMRTISLGSWQAAVKRQERVRLYSQRLLAMLPSLIPHLHLSARGRQRDAGPARGQAEQGEAQTKTGLLQALSSVRRAPSPDRAQRRSVVVFLVIGSERGLCGAFNSSLAGYADRLLAERQADGTEVELAALGTRVVRALRRTGREVAWSRPLPMTTLPTSGLAHELTDRWLEGYEAYELDAVELVYNTYRNSTLYEPIASRLIPPPVSLLAEGEVPWPPPFVDTDPMSLYAHLIGLWVTTEMYRVLLDSTAAEHSARYQLMEGATQNSERLIDELTLALQAARQHAITSEMQELASGAGLVGGQS
jgi:F-type H+-transporting ATPase subunit gamma